MYIEQIANGGLTTQFTSPIKDDMYIGVNHNNSQYYTTDGYTGKNISSSNIRTKNNLQNNTNNVGLGEKSAGNFNTGNANGSNNGNNIVDDFLSHFKNGIIRPSRYRVEFKLPRGVSGGGTAVNKEAQSGNMKKVEQALNSAGGVNIKCHNAVFPGRAISGFEYRSNSVPFTVAQYTGYEPITFTFYADSVMDTRYYFELWQSAIMNFGNNTLNFYDEYTSDVKLYMQDLSGRDVYGVILYEAYPSMVGQFDASYSATNQALNIQITMRYKSWMPLSNSNHMNRTVMQ